MYVYTLAVCPLAWELNAFLFAWLLNVINFLRQDDEQRAAVMVETPGEPTDHDHTGDMEASPADERNGDVDLGTEAQELEPEIPEPVLDATQRLQDALMKRDNGKNSAEKRGATPKPKPKAKVKVLKRPSAKKASAKKLCGKPKPKSHDKPVKKGRELKMTVQCVYSRAYHAAQSTLDKQFIVFTFSPFSLHYQNQVVGHQTVDELYLSSPKPVQGKFSKVKGLSEEQVTKKARAAGQLAVHKFSKGST